MNSEPSDTAARTVGRYEILRRIGRGGMATVYLARQEGLDREVALKELDHFGVADQALFASRFLREAKLAASLSHPNIVTVLDYFEHDGRPYIAMELLEGGSLREYLRDLSLAQIIGVLEGLLAGLTHAEDRGIAHRDIKPENILVTGEGRIKLTDFGIARAYNAALSVLTVAGTTVGTPKYMAPEQGTGGDLSARTDLYAAGIVAYEMLVGTVPFDAEENALAIVWQHVHDPVPDPREACPELDQRLCRWLQELLQKDPDDRPPSARAALDALEEIVVDLLGPHWRRDARLAAPRVANRGPRPLTPAHVDEVSDGHDVPEGIRLDDAPRKHDDAGSDAPSAPTLAPRSPRNETAAFRDALKNRAAGEPRAHSKQPAGRTAVKHKRGDAPRPAALPRPRRRLLALLAGLGVAMALAGFALFGVDDRTPRTPGGPAVSQTRANAAQQAARQGYIVALRTVLDRFGRARSAALTQLRAAKTRRSQSSAAGDVGRSYRDAAEDLAKLAPTASQRGPAARVRVQMRRVARRYEQLGAAAKAGGAKRYAAARTAIAAGDKKLNRLVAQIPA